MTEPKRDHWGRYILTDPTKPGEENHPWTRATTLASTLDDSYGLTAWKMRMVALGISKREDLYDLACGSDPDDKKQLDELCDKCIDAVGGDAKANQGTALHKFTARLDSGELARSPRKWEKDLAAYVEWKEQEGILTHPRFIERVTVVPDLGVAGTMDRIAKHDGEAKIGDVKTGSLEHKGLSISIQLAIYAHGKGLWNMETGEWEPMPKVSQTEGLVFHLPAGEAKPELYFVDLEFGWKMAQLAFCIREARKRKDILVSKIDREGTDNG